MTKVFQRTKNAKRNIITGIFNKIISIFAPFIIRTIIIKKLGLDYLGLDSLFTSILQILNMSELGLSTAIVYCMYKPLSEGNVNEVNALYSFFRKAYSVIGLIVLAVGLIILPFVPNFIKGEVPLNVNVYLLYLIYLANSVLSYLFFAYKNVILNANQRLDITNNILTISRIFMYCIQILMLLLFSNYYLYIIFLPISTLLNNIITSICVDKMYPEFKPVGKIKNEAKKDIAKQVSGLCLGKITVVSRNSFDSVVISTYLGLVITAIYNNYYYIMNAVISVLVVITSSIVPIVGNSVVTESKEKNHNDFLKFNFIFMWLVGWCTCCLLCMYQPFMRIWVGTNSMLSNTSMTLFCIYFFVYLIGNIRSVYVDAAGIWWQNRKRLVAEAISNLVLNILLCKHFGVNGVIFATIITIVGYNFMLGTKILYQYYFTEQKASIYYKNSLYYSLVTIFACICSYLVCSILDKGGISQLIYNFAVCIIIPNVIFFVLYCRTREFHEAYSWIKNSLLKK